jgi:ParB-like chromosome segregation protein Spo0J
MHYLRLLEENETDDLGVIYLKPYKDDYEILDGHHRYTACVMSGRPDALALIIDESNC